jgi:hypothetical protein
MPADLAEATRNRLNVQSRKRCIRCRIQDSHSRLSEHRERLRHVWQIDERDGLIANISPVRAEATPASRRTWNACRAH